MKLLLAGLVLGLVGCSPSRKPCYHVWAESKSSSSIVRYDTYFPTLKEAQAYFDSLHGITVGGIDYMNPMFPVSCSPAE